PRGCGGPADISCRLRSRRRTRAPASWGQTDWPEILSLYEVLRLIDPSPVVDLNRAIALRYAIGPAEALVAVDALAEPLERYHLFHATRAELLRDLGRPGEARAADARALALT